MLKSCTIEEKPTIGNKEKTLIEKQCDVNEKNIEEIENFDFKDIFYSKEDIQKYINFINEIIDILKSNDSSKDFLKKLKKKGVFIIEKSSFLASQKSLNNLLGFDKSGINALFATQGMIQNYLLINNISSSVKYELENVRDSKCVIFLNENPTPKSIFHEGFHAIQYLSGLNMNAKDKKVKLMREIEVSKALIHFKKLGKLNEISSGNYKKQNFRLIGKITEGLILDLNDIYQEVNNFFNNKDLLLRLIEENKKNDDLEKIKKVKEKIKET